MTERLNMKDEMIPAAGRITGTHSLAVKGDLARKTPVKSVVVSTVRGGRIDGRVISRRFINRLNLRSIAGIGRGRTFAVGVTSMHPREGKTLVACNLAVSLAIGTRVKTALLDLNPVNPAVHEAFGIPVHPGLQEALNEDTIHVTSSRIERLSILPAGDHGAPQIGLENLSQLADDMQSLRFEYPLIIVDMPSLAPEEITEAIVSYLNGVIVVVDTRRTTRRDVDRAFRRLPNEQVLGLVFNRVEEDEY
jgi:Mrp family chromosome partitioning ATPase